MEELELRRAAAAAQAGHEVRADLLKSTPSRTLYCDGREFKRLRSLARTGRPFSVCCMPVLSPLCTFYRIWLWVATITDMTYTAFMVSLSIAFNNAGGFDANSWLDYADLVGSLIYFVDLLLGFHVGVIARWDVKAVVVLDGRSTASFYLRPSTGTFSVDLIAFLPAVVQMAVRASGTSRNSLRLLYLMRLLRMIRVIRLLKNITPGAKSSILQPFAAVFSIQSLLLFNAFFSLAVLVNLLGCIWWNIAVTEGLDNSWAASVTADKNIDLLQGTDLQRWVVSIYFAMTTVATIGYGDITPMTVPEVGVTIIFQMIGVAYFAYIINVATSILSASGTHARRAQAVKGKLEDAEEAMQSMGLPRLLRSRIRTYFTDQWVPSNEGSHDLRFQLYVDLPAMLRARLVQAKQERALLELGFLPDSLNHRQRKQVMHIMAAASVPVRLQAGQRLAQAVPEAPPSDEPVIDLKAPCIFILDEGEMRVARHGEEPRPLRQHTLIGGRVDFAGPAVIGLKALFSPEAAPEGGGSGLAGGGTTAGSGGKERAGTGAEAEAEAEGLAQAPEPAGPQSEADVSGDDSSSGGSSSGGEQGSAPGRLSDSWQQDALALTECHLWRVDCRQLFHDLRAKQPWVLLHLLDRLLLSLGVRLGPAAEAAASGGTGSADGSYTATAGSVGAAGASAGGLPAQLQRRGLRSFRGGTVARLQGMRAELAAAIREAEEQLREAAQAGGGRTKPSVHPSRPSSSGWVSSPSMPTLASKSAELVGVSVAPGSISKDWSGPDVWHADG